MMERDYSNIPDWKWKEIVHDAEQGRRYEPEFSTVPHPVIDVKKCAERGERRKDEKNGEMDIK